MEDKEVGRVIGYKQTLKIFEKKEMECINRIYLAKDTDREIADQIIENCKVNNINIEYVPTKKQLGKQAGIDVGASVVCLVNKKEKQRR